MYLSEAKGFGLELETLKEGTVILIGGGTGINPYLDLIDLLFKQQLIEKEPSLAS